MAEIISVTQPATETATQTISLLDQFLALWWLWLLILGGLIVALFFIIKFILKLKEDEDELIILYKQRRKLCKQHRNRFYYKSFFKKTKNAPVKCMWKEGDRWKEKTIGYYYGDYYGKEGTHLLAVMKERSAKWFVLPDIGVIILNKRPNRKIRYRDSQNQPVETEQTMPTDIEEFMESEIILKCVGIDKLDKEGRWLVPILKDQQGNIMNPTSYSFESFKDVVMGEYLLTNMNDALQQAKKALDTNQWIRGKNKLEDKSQSIETPSQ